MRPPIRIYLAGPGVFRTDVRAYFDGLFALCLEFGVEGVAPADGQDGEPSEAPHERAARIYRENVRRIRECDGVLAGADPFRGFEPDSGTAFEMGFATALGKPVAAYVTDTRELITRLTESVGTLPRLDGRRIDLREHMLVEDFGLSLNLMLAHGSATVADSPRAALGALIFTIKNARNGKARTRVVQP